MITALKNTQCKGESRFQGLLHPQFALFRTIAQLLDQDVSVKEVVLNLTP
jgi:hypothetical protein